MSPAINCSEATKQDFKALKPDDLNQAEFLAELLSVYRAAGTATVDVETFVSDIRRELCSQAEIGAKRGVNEALCADPEPTEAEAIAAAREVIQG